MHPLINVYLAEAIQDERLRRAERRRRARRPAMTSISLPAPRAPWSPGWSARHPGLRSD
jgi:hypothetical protein